MMMGAIFRGREGVVAPPSGPQGGLVSLPMGGREGGREGGRSHVRVWLTLVASWCLLCSFTFYQVSSLPPYMVSFFMFLFPCCWVSCWNDFFTFLFCAFPYFSSSYFLSLLACLFFLAFFVGFRFCFSCYFSSFLAFSVSFSLFFLLTFLFLSFLALFEEFLAYVKFFSCCFVLSCGCLCCVYNYIVFVVTFSKKVTIKPPTLGQK